MVIAYSYVRFSSLKQEEGDSLRRQTEATEAYCKRKGWNLSTKTYRDLGVSAFRGKNALVGNLGEFLRAVKAGAVKPGSVLIVESFDRITRQGIDDGYDLVKSILKADITIVTLLPEREFDAGATKSLSKGALEIQLILERAAEESEMKSRRLGATWKEKKRKAGTDLVPYGRQCPAWLELVGKERPAGGRQDFSKTKYRVKDDAAATVRKVFQLCVSGLGLTSIVARLNKDNVPPIGRSGRWWRFYVHQLLRNPAAIGIYQPMTGSDKRVPDGEPVPGYYPAVVEEGVWYAAQAAMKARARRSGRPATGTCNPFSGLLRDAVDGSKLYIVHGGGGYKYLIPTSIIHRQSSAKWRSFPLKPLVSALLEKMSELSAAELFKDPGSSRVNELEGKLQATEKRLAAATAKWEADPESMHWQGLVDKHDREKRALVKELAEARAAAANPASAAWAEAVALMAKDDPERLRQVLLTTVESVYCLFISDRPDRTAIVQVFFHGGAVRWYRIHHRERVGLISAESWDLPAVGSLDLRRPEDAAMVESILRLGGKVAKAFKGKGGK